MAGRKLDIAIIGGGTSGLAAAIFFKRDGHNVTLFERFDTPQPLGAGILLQPTGLAVLAQLGLDDTVVSYGAKIETLYGTTAQGRLILDIHYSRIAPHIFGLGVHRGALFKVLFEEAQRLGIAVQTSSEITTTELHKDKRLIAGSAYDLVIDASGAKSKLRRFGNIRYDIAYPYGAVWGVCEDAGQGFGRNLLQQRYDRAKVMIGILAIGKRPQDMKEAVTFFWSLPVNAYAAWREQGLGPWKERVLNYWPDVAPFLEQFKTVDDLTFAQYNYTLMKEFHTDRMAFIGDAAHATSPQLGQGANLGLIDAMLLAQAVRDHEEIDAALSAYTKSRASHVCFYQTASRWLTPFFQSDSLAAALLRDYTFGLMCKVPYVQKQMLQTLGGVKTGLFSTLNPGAWHARYDTRSSQPR